MKTVFDLMTAVVNKLSGKDVHVRLCEPATVGCAGECHRALNGRLVVDIKPGLDNETTLRVLCHESAHAKLHPYYRSDVYAAKPGTLPLSPQTQTYQKRESEADALAERWINFAKSKADNFEDWLWALLDWDGE